MKNEIVIKHYIIGRVRLKSICFSNAQNLDKIKRVLSKEIIEFKSNIKTNSITILFNEKKLSLDKLVGLIKKIFNIDINNANISKTIDTSLFSILKVMVTFGLSGFSVFKNYFFDIKRVTDTTLNVFKFVKYIKVI